MDAKQLELNKIPTQKKKNVEVSLEVSIGDVLETEIKSLQLSLIQMRRKLIIQRQNEAFLYFTQISSNTLIDLFKKEKLLTRLLYDSVEDGDDLCYFVDLALGDHTFMECIHTDPALADHEWQNFLPNILDKFKPVEKESKTSSDKTLIDKISIDRTDKYWITLLEVLHCKDLDERAWQRIAPHVAQHPKSRDLVAAILFARLFYILGQTIEDQQPLPGRCYPCECVTHYAQQEGSWIFPCLGLVPFEK